MQCKLSRFGNGNKYEIKLIGVDKRVWVHEKQLSKGVHKTFQADGSLAKGAKALVNRGFVIEQKEFFKVVITFVLIILGIITHVFAVLAGERTHRSRGCGPYQIGKEACGMGGYRAEIRPSHEHSFDHRS